MNVTSQAPPKITSESPNLPLAALAGRIGNELEVLARISAEVQTALSLCRFAEHTDPEAIRGLQGIDRITQSLEDLGRLMAALSGEIPYGIHLRALPILSRLRLQELAQNLDPTMPRSWAEITTPRGEIDWF